MLEPSLDLYGETYDKVDVVLDDLLEKCHGRYAMIIDRQGFVLMHNRSLWAPKPPSLDSLATLIASNYSANTAIANLFGEEGFKEMVQQGDDVGTYIEELGSKALLVTVFDSSAALGKVKLFTKRAVVDIRQHLHDGKGQPAPTIDFDQEWSDSTEALLDGLFGGGKE
jgi:predicted regulator of Ras-like GTPase activity (Roadblock/LC7/MglB family)